MGRQAKWRVGTLVLGLLCSAPCSAETFRPLFTEDAETLPRNHLELQTGFRFEDGVVPVKRLRNVEGDRLLFPLIGFNWGLGQIGEFQIQGIGFQDFSPDGNAFKDTDAVGDFTLLVKVVPLKEKEGKARPAIGFRVGVKLPNVSETTFLGTNETDALGQFLLTKTWGDLKLHFNTGIAILGDPIRLSRQVDVGTYGLALVYEMIPNLSVVVDVNGQTDFQGNRYGFDQSQALLGLVREARLLRFDVGVLAGLIDESPDWGGTFGVTWKLNQH